MKKLLIILVVFLGVLFSMPDLLAGCNQPISGGFEVGPALDGCLSDSKLIKGENTLIGSGGGFTIKIQNWVNNISIYLGVLAVGSIVFGALMMTLSGGEDEKLKKAKDIVKWGIIGFVGLISVTAIVNLIVKIMYSI